MSNTLFMHIAHYKLGSIQSQPGYIHISANNEMHQHEVKEQFYSALKDTCHGFVIRIIMALCFYISSHLGHRAPQVSMVDDSCMMVVINYKGFITTTVILINEQTVYYIPPLM